ncbi:MAG: LysM peptidoglycan-binding domain-containing protein [Hyphomicrobiales bacterium]|nr:LysM peptidoglycan-binding domain-containing protein [Hyphomicrobiales bacterium]
MAGISETVKNRHGLFAAVGAGVICVLAVGAAWYSFWPGLQLPHAVPGFLPTGAAPIGASTGENTSKPTKGANETELALAPATGGLPGPPATGTVAANPQAKANDGSDTSQQQRPEFDIVRVERSGEGVIAGRGTPGATIALKDGDKELARAVADANGEVVFLPPPLSPGDHALSLQSLPGAGPSVSSQSVKVVVPKSEQEAVKVARATPEQSASSLSDASTTKPQAGTSPSGSATSKSAPAVAIRSAQAEEGGSFLVTGSAPPGSQSRLYLNGAFVGKVIADLNGLWSLKVEKGMQPGHYAVRADEVEPESGKVIARAEVPFDFPVTAPTVTTSTAPTEQLSKPSVATAAKDQPKAQPPAAPSGVASATTGPASTTAGPASTTAGPASATPGPATAVIKEVRTTTVVRGDSLWRISKKMLGRGTRYTQIYEANASQIRNPRLVFPGQVFVLPSDPG